MIKDLPEKRDSAHEIIFDLRAQIDHKNSQLDTKQSLINDQQVQINVQQTTITSLEKHLAFIKEQLRLAIAYRFGRASEKARFSNDAQQSLFDEAELAALMPETDEQAESEGQTVEVAAHTKRKRGKRTSLPDYLEREEVIYELPESELVTTQGDRYTKIGEEVTEKLDVIPAQVKVIRHIRFKYAVKGKEELGVKIATLPKQLIEKSIASPGLLAHTAVNKFAYHLPYYRQEQIWQACDVIMPCNSLSRWMIQAGEAVAPLVEDYLFEDMLLTHYLHVDETPVTVLQDKDKNPENPSHRGYVWVYVNNVGVVFDYQSSRHGIHPKDKLEAFTGHIQSDAYSGYHGLFTDKKRIALGCMAHARRKFTDIQKTGGKKKKHPVADQVVNLMAKLYHIEKIAKDQNLTVDEITQYRQEKAVPILDKLHAYLTAQKPKAPDKSLLGKAIAYSLNHWAALCCYTTHGKLNIDNNPAERAIRPFTVGRKNWLFHGNTRAAKAAANLYSLIETAKIHNLNPFAYLKHVFEKLPRADSPRQLEQLLPYHAREACPHLLLSNLKQQCK